MNSLYTKRILVVDDEVAIAQMIRIILEKEGWTDITVVHTYQDAEEAIQRENFDFYLLDIMLPDGSGLDLATVAREKGNAPIFFLTALTSDADVLTGFMQGADDYIKKPFNPLELAARVNAQMKRYVGQNRDNDRIRFGHCLLDTKAAILFVENEEVELTGKQ
ncbi:MAG TPA: response regulator transcription factor, partial [Savagea sp.]